MDFTETAQHARDHLDADDIGYTESNIDNVAQAAKLMIAEADRAVQSCNEVLHDQLAKVGRKVPTENIVAVIYTAYCAIAVTGSQAQFLADRHIKVHGSTKNDCYPVFQAFTRSAHPWLRDRVCKYAQVAALAFHEKVAPETFPDWLKRNPIEKACREYRRIMRERSRSERNEHLQRVWEFLVDPKKEPDKAPIVPATPITPGYAGVKLAVIDFAHDGSGNFRVLGIMPHDADAVMRMALTVASKETKI
ncbi:MAG: hypothetical protein NT113_18020 [Hyphomicrobiales bacterium]|nr:hypothetical protein [Hyphomicrobiales bacterium]